MKLLAMQNKLDLQRISFKQKIWQNFCSSDYPDGLSDEKFVKIILHKAQKSYPRYESFYKTIGLNKEGSLKQLKYNSTLIFKNFSLLSEVQIGFRQIIERLKIEKKFYKSVEDFENLSMAVWKDVYLIEYGYLKTA